MRAPRADSDLLSLRNASIMRTGGVLAVRAPWPHLDFIGNVANISQLGRVRVHQPEVLGNAIGFATGACCVRPLLRQSPAATAEWAKPREIRRGTSVEAPGGASGCRRPRQITSILLLRNSFPDERARPVLPDPLGPELPNIEKHMQKCCFPARPLKFLEDQNYTVL